MIRLLIVSIIATTAALNHFGMDLNAAGGYAIVTCPAAIFLWRLTRTIQRHRRRTRQRSAPTAVQKEATRPSPVTHLTQINHHHYYGWTPDVPSQHVPVPSGQLALPERSDEQRAHADIYDAIFFDGPSQ